MPLQRKTITAANALTRLQDLCARSEQCTYDLMQKMRRWGLGSSDAEKVMEQLYEGRYCDDRRFAEAFVRDKALYNRWGRRKIALALHAKRIPSNLASDALDTIDPDEYIGNLRALARAKARTLGPLDDYAEKARLFRFLASRGFEPDLISRTVRELQNDNQ